MGKPYSLDLRERVVAALEGGMSTAQAAARFSIGKATAGAWGRLKRSQGDVRPAKQGRPKGSVLDAHEAFILGALQDKPDTTLEEMVERLAAAANALLTFRPTECANFFAHAGYGLD